LSTAIFGKFRFALSGAKTQKRLAYTAKRPKLKAKSPDRLFGDLGL
jgi:hypothetical protein